MPLNKIAATKKTKLRISIMGLNRDKRPFNATFEADVYWTPMNKEDIGKPFELRHVYEIEIADHIGNLHKIGGYMPGKMLVHK